MADPKYQNLAYVAVGQPDVYESADLPESDQTIHDPEEHDDVVERLMVDPKDAFKRFNRATIDSTGSNFSEESIPGRTGYAVQYEVISSDDKLEETIVQKLQRLKLELKEIEDLAKTRLQKEVNPASIMAEVEMLQKQIESFSGTCIASSESNTLAYGQLLTQLKSVSKGKTDSKSQQKLGKAQAASDQTLYELRYVADVAQAAKEANLEARITQMEQLLGSPKEWSALNDGSARQPVMESLSVLSSKLHLLEEDNVDKLSARLQILLQTLTKVKENSFSSEARDMDKVNDLYELVKKWDTCVDSLPLIVDRLYTLQDLHQQAMEFSSSLKALETAQNELSQSIGSHQQLLADVHKTFTVNVDVIKSNVDNLEKRIVDLK